MSAPGPSASGAEGSERSEAVDDPLDVRLAWPGQPVSYATSEEREAAHQAERDDERLLAEVSDHAPSPDEDELPSDAVAMLVDAYERLGGRMLTRLRELRDETRTDVAELRSEVADLRAAIGDVADRVQLRQLRTSVDDLRNDVAALRSASTELQEAVARAGSGPGAATVDVPPALQEQLDAVAEELSGLREEVVSLRRRIAVRADAGGLRPEDIEVIADAVAKRLRQTFRSG